MKVGRDAEADLARVHAARQAIGDHVELFVDANGGYTRKQALAMAGRFAGESNVTWFEEPRPSDDLEGLHLLCDRAPAGMDIAAGEYGDTTDYFRRMLAAKAVGCLQADVTRCGGYTGFLKVAALCDAFHVPLSAHCAPQCTPMSDVPCRGCVTWNTFTIMCGSIASYLTASSNPRMGSCNPTAAGPATA